MAIIENSHLDLMSIFLWHWMIEEIWFRFFLSRLYVTLICDNAIEVNEDFVARELLVHRHKDGSQIKNRKWKSLLATKNNVCLYLYWMCNMAREEENAPLREYGLRVAQVVYGLDQQHQWANKIFSDWMMFYNPVHVHHDRSLRIIWSRFFHCSEGWIVNNRLLFFIILI
jgi:hypothetical protein